MLEETQISQAHLKTMPAPTSNVAIAYRKLKQAILENQLAPGAQLLEQEAATQLEMSRTPVREAMLMLQKGWLGRNEATSGDAGAACYSAGYRRHLRNS